MSPDKFTLANSLASSIWRRILMATAGSGDAGSPSNPRSYLWVRRRSPSYHLVFCRETRDYRLIDEAPYVFRRKTRDGLGAGVYRKSTGDLVLGKYPGKECGRLLAPCGQSLDGASSDAGPCRRRRFRCQNFTPRLPLVFQASTAPPPDPAQTRLVETPGTIADMSTGCHGLRRARHG
jgi:hypothetical protein